MFVSGRSLHLHFPFDDILFCTGKPDPPNLHQYKGRWAAFAGVKTHLWPTIYHLGTPDLPWHGSISDWGPAASGGQIATVEGFGWSLRVMMMMMMMMMISCSVPEIVVIKSPSCLKLRQNFDGFLVPRFLTEFYKSGSPLNMMQWPNTKQPPRSEGSTPKQNGWLGQHSCVPVIIFSCLMQCSECCYSLVMFNVCWLGRAQRRTWMTTLLTSHLLSS